MTELHKNFRLLKPMLKGWPVILIILIISLWIGARYLQYATPMYESTTMIKLALENESLTGANPLDVFSSNSKIAEEVQVLKSSMLITRVLDSVQFDISYFRIGKIRSTEMYHETPFVVVAYDVKNKSIYSNPIALTIQNNVIKIIDPFNDKKTTATFDQLIHLNGLDLRINLNNELIKQKPDIRINDDYTFVIYNKQQQINIVKKNLDVTSVDKDVAVLRVTYKSPVARKAADVVNKLTTYEHDPQWALMVKSKVKEHPEYDTENFSLQVMEGNEVLKDLEKLENKHYDMLLVDCMNAYTPRTECIRIAKDKVKDGGWVILDNSDNPANWPADEIMSGKELHRFTGYTPMSLFVCQTSFWKM